MSCTRKILRRTLNLMIRKLGESREEFVKRPGRDFTRPWALTFETVIFLLLTMSENSIGKVSKQRTNAVSIGICSAAAKAAAIGAGDSVSPLYGLAAS